MKEYRIQRKEDHYWITSRDVCFVDAGVWINDDLEAGSKGTRIFLPLHNINQINEYEVDFIREDFNEFKVIGNIYENKELLNTKGTTK